MRKSAARVPILEFTTRQAIALERELRARFRCARRRRHALLASVHRGRRSRRWQQHAPGELVLLPLYPQYSKTTTGSSLNEWTRRFHPNGWNPRVHVVEEFYEDAAYLDSVVEAVDASLARVRRSARCGYRVQRAQRAGGGDREGRSVPAADRAHDRTGLAARRDGRARRHLCYQSKVGASKWLRRRCTRPSSTWRQRAARSAGGADLVRLGSRGDAARDRYRASRAGARAWAFEITG